MQSTNAIKFRTYMYLFKLLKVQIDQKCRKKKFARILLTGVKSEMLSAIGYVKEHIKHQNLELNEEKEFWKERIEYVNSLYTKLNSFGFRNRKEYFESPDEELSSEILDIIEAINRSAITSEAEADYSKSLDEFYEEIKASEKVLEALEKMAPIIAHLKVSTVEDIDKAFRDNDCIYLLNMPNIIDFSKILEKHYNL